MGVIVANTNKPHVVVVDRAPTAVVVEKGIESAVTQDRTSVATVTEKTRPIETAGVGIQGPRGSVGPPGPQGGSDNDTFDDNLLLLYQIAKAP